MKENLKICTRTEIVRMKKIEYQRLHGVKFNPGVVTPMHAVDQRKISASYLTFTSS